MSKLNTPLTYPLLLIVSTVKRSFEALGSLVDKSGDTMKRWLSPKEVSLTIAVKIAQHMFENNKELTLSIDDSLLHKIHSMLMVGTGKFYDTKLGKRVTAFRLIVGALTNGRHTIPVNFGYFFTKELLSSNDIVKTKLDFIKEFYAEAKRLFPDKKIRIAADGLFATVEFFRWALANSVMGITRMHSNRKVTYKGQEIKINQIEDLKLKGKQKARTIKVMWYGLELFITAEKRISKSGKESIVFLAATYKARPSKYVKDYKKRWPIEKFFRTAKQYLGIQECFSRDLDIQSQHIAAVFVAYAIAQYEMKKRSLDNSEQAIKALKRKKPKILIDHFARSNQMFSDFYA